MEPEGGIECPSAGVAMNPLSWEANSGPLQEHCILLITELSLQPQQFGLDGSSFSFGVPGALRRDIYQVPFILLS